MPDSNDFFGNGARSDWTRQPVSAPRYQLAGTGASTRPPVGPGARQPAEHDRPARSSGYGGGLSSRPPTSAPTTAPAATPAPARRDAQPASAPYGEPSTLDWMDLTGAGTALPAAPQESTPIFDALVSAWFRKGSSLFSKDRSSSAAASAESDEPTSEPATEATSWPSASDQGWQAAEAVAQSKPDSYTTSGLPRRTPNARLLPGSMAPDAGAAGRHVDRKPEEMRSRLSDFQRGSTEGRHNVSTKKWSPVWEENEQRAE